MDEVLDCGCRYEDREVPDAQEFVPEIDCPIHGLPEYREVLPDGSERTNG